MVEDHERLSAVFRALSHETRRDMVERLAGRPLTVSQLAEPLAMSLAGASKHIGVLERAGLISRTVEGRKHVCRLDPGPLMSASTWTLFYQRHWQQRLDTLEETLREDDSQQEEET